MVDLRIEDAGGVRTLTLDRPEARNALSLALVEGLRAALTEARADPGVRALVLAGAPPAFCAGADVREWAEAAKAGRKTPWVETAHALVREIFAFPRPVVAAVRGAAAGAGVDLVLACDFRFAAADARFVCAYTRMAFPPDLGGTWLLPRLIGPAAAKRFVFTGAPWSAEEALAAGLVDAVHPTDDVLAAAQAFAATLAAGPTVAQAHAKRLIDGALSRGFAAQLAEEYAAGDACRRTDDAAEAMRAAVEKRAPVFTGR